MYTEFPKETNKIASDIDDFRDPRLHHLNAYFRRDSLNYSQLEQFSDDPV